MQQSAVVPAVAQRTAPDLRPVTSYVLWLLLLAGAGEMFLFRTLSRVGVHVPKHGLVLRVYDALVSVGSFAFNVSTVTVFVAVALLTYAALRQVGSSHALLAAVAPLIAAFAAFSLVLDFVDEGEGVKLIYGLIFAAIMIALAVQGLSDRHRPLSGRLVIALIVIAYLGAQYYVLANESYRVLGLTSAPPGITTALELAELVVLVNAALVFVTWSGLRRGARWRRLWPQAAVALLLMIAFVGAYRGENSSAAAILSLWTLGLTMYLPLPLYVLALGLYSAAATAALMASRGDPAKAGEGIALGLLPVAGLTLDLTYQHLVAVVVLLLLVGAGALHADQSEAGPAPSAPASA